MPLVCFDAEEVMCGAQRWFSRLSWQNTICWFWIIFIVLHFIQHVFSLCDRRQTRGEQENRRRTGGEHKENRRGAWEQEIKQQLLTLFSCCSQGRSGRNEFKPLTSFILSNYLSKLPGSSCTNNCQLISYSINCYISQTDSSSLRFGHHTEAQELWRRANWLQLDVQQEGGFILFLFLGRQWWRSSNVIVLNTSTQCNWSPFNMVLTHIEDAKTFLRLILLSFHQS